MRDKRVLKFEQLGRQVANRLLRRLPALDVGRQESGGDGEAAHVGVKLRAVVGARFRAPPGRDRRLQFPKLPVETRLGDRRREVADECRRRTALGDRALRRVVRGVEIDVRQIPDQPVRPAAAGQARLLARHELERAVGAEVKNRVGSKVLAKVPVERRKRMGGCEAALEQQPHGIPLVAERGLDADEDVSVLLAEDVQRAAIRLLPAGRRAPLLFNRGQPRLAAQVILDRDSNRDVGDRPQLRRVAVQDLLPQLLERRRNINAVAAGAHLGQKHVQRLEYRKISSGADIAGIGREIEHDDRDPSLRARPSAERHKSGNA